MLPLGHIAYTWAGLAAAEAGWSWDIDYRAAALAALLPDLIDKPLALTVMRRSGTSQGLGHTLLFHALLTLLTVWKRWKWSRYALTVNLHLVADQMWKYRSTFCFPFLGRLEAWTFMGTPSAMLNAYAEIARSPEVLAVELVGLGLLIRLVRKAQLYRPNRAKAFLLTGRLNPGARLADSRQVGD